MLTSYLSMSLLIQLILQYILSVARAENPESPDARYSDPTIDQPHVAYFYANVFNPHTKYLLNNYS